MKELNFGSIIPLVGGNILGCTKSAGEDPSFHLSYSAFANNENIYVNINPMSHSIT